ncbi:MAG: catalase [Ruminococcaceae bacterium]|nr:catalase [Oscillospiraceae bacterium]
MRNENIMKALKHFNTITKHRHKVIEHCFKAGIGFQGLFHDLSKYAPVEFLAGARYYQGTRSPNEEERRLFGHSKAWMHHKGRNRHHFEYWTDYNPRTKLVEPVEMPLNYVAEMFCDRVAASKIYNGKTYKDSDPLEYFLKAKARRVIHKKTSEELENLLTMLRDKGEKDTFAYLKSRIKAYRKQKKSRAN